MNSEVRRWLLLALATLAALSSLVLVERLVTRQGWQLDLTPTRKYTLSEEGRRLLSDVDVPMQLTAFVRSGDSQNHDLRKLLERVTGIMPKVSFEWVDMDRSPAVARSYDVRTAGVVVVEAGGRRRDLGHVDENQLVATITQVANPQNRKVYFTSGHRETSVAERHRKLGGSDARFHLMREFYEVEELGNLAGGVPVDASALIAFGPQSDFLPAELRRIEEYVGAGGGFLALLDAEVSTNLDALLELWGVTSGLGAVLDARNRMFAGDMLTFLVPEVDPRHPITSRLIVPPLFSRTRHFLPASEGAELVGEIIRTSADSWASPDPDVTRLGVGTYDANRDFRGPLALGVALEVSGSEGGQVGRLVALADADFASNFLFDKQGNRDLFMNCVHWAAQAEARMRAAGPVREPGVEDLFIPVWVGNRLFWFACIVQPSVALAIGFAIFSYRRKNA